jgi:hypothetical protein
MCILGTKYIAVKRANGCGIELGDQHTVRSLLIRRADNAFVAVESEISFHHPINPSLHERTWYFLPCSTIVSLSIFLALPFLGSWIGSAACLPSVAAPSLGLCVLDFVAFRSLLFAVVAVGIQYSASSAKRSECCKPKNPPPRSFASGEMLHPVHLHPSPSHPPQQRPSKFQQKLQQLPCPAMVDAADNLAFFLAARTWCG